MAGFGTFLNDIAVISDSEDNANRKNVQLYVVRETPNEYVHNRPIRGRKLAVVGVGLHIEFPIPIHEWCLRT